MTTELQPVREGFLHPGDTDPVMSDTIVTANSRPQQPRPKRRKKPLSSRVNLWLRRIHLFSGLFMLPWVLLYGFTALLFNHPTYMTDSSTAIDPISVDQPGVAGLPSAGALAELAVAFANTNLNTLNGEGEGHPIQLTHPDSARFTRQAVGILETDERNLNVVLDLNTGAGYVRTRIKSSAASSRSANAAAPGKLSPLSDGLDLKLDYDAAAAFRAGVKPALKTAQIEADLSNLRLRSLPTLEFEALINGTPKRLRLSATQNRRGQSTRGQREPRESTQQFEGKLQIVGENPRDLSARNFLLRLHKSHGYPIQTNARWFWAVAVDLMFASMCFWGLSGVVMWWQIKRTRKLGGLLLVASAVVATWLAIGMHWQLVNG